MSSGVEKNSIFAGYPTSELTSAPLSITRAVSPSRFASIAHARPTGPAPITMMSCICNRPGGFAPPDPHLRRSRGPDAPLRSGGRADAR
jgi:hypothetical protein